MQRGSTLPGVLTVISLVAILGFMLVARATLNLQLASHDGTLHTRGDVLDSLIDSGVERLQSDATFSDTVSLAPPQIPRGMSGLLTFDTNAPIYSVNNIGSDTSTMGYGNTPVPANCAQLVGVLKREYGGQDVLDAIVHYGIGQYAIVSRGPLHSNGGLYVATQPFDGSDTGPARVGVDASGPDAVRLGANTTIVGDVSAVGGIQLGGARVTGAVTPYAAAAPLPQLTASSLDPGAVPTVGNSGGKVTVSGVMRYNGDFVAPDDVTLNNGVLYVNGDATFNGQVLGQGAIIATGQVQLKGGASIATDDMVALLADGDVTIEGKGQSLSAFNGIVYTGGSLLAEHIRLAGMLVQNGAAGQIVVNDVALYHIPMGTGVSFASGAVAAMTSFRGQYHSFGGSGLPLPSPLIYKGVNLAGADFRGWFEGTQGGHANGVSGAVYRGTTRVMTVKIQPFPPTTPDDIAFTAALLTSLNSHATQLTTSDWVNPTSGGPHVPTSALGGWTGATVPTIPIATATSSSGSAAAWSADLNNFLLPADRFQVLLWQKL